MYIIDYELMINLKGLVYRNPVFKLNFKWKIIYSTMIRTVKQSSIIRQLITGCE